MLRKQGEPDALAHLQRSLHMYPGGVGVWKTLGHALAQDEMPLPASAAFGAACALTQASGGDVAAQTGLATMLTQLGRPAAATDELIRIRKSAKANDAGVSVMAEPLERLCRRLMPGHRFTAVQSNARRQAWQNAILASGARARVLDISDTPLTAVLAAKRASPMSPVLRIENLPLSIARASQRPNLPACPSDLGADVTVSLPRAPQERFSQRTKSRWTARWRSLGAPSAEISGTTSTTVDDQRRMP